MRTLKFTLQNYKLTIKIKDKIDEATYIHLESILNEEIKKYISVTDMTDTNSEIYRFNTSINEFRGTRDFFDYLMDAIYWFGITDGIFNPFVITISKEFNNVQSNKEDGEYLFKLDHIDYDFPKKINQLSKYIDIDYTNYRVKFIRPVRVDLIGISKGILIDKLVKKICCKELKNYSVTFGGDSFYQSENGSSPWTVSIGNPITNKSSELNIEAYNEAVSISGNIGKNDIIEDLSKYILLDPIKQKPYESDLAIVIIKADNCKTSDVLAKTFLIVPKEDRENLSKKFKNIQRIEIDKKGKLTVY